jgi:hypothetical protein
MPRIKKEEKIIEEEIVTVSPEKELDIVEESPIIEEASPIVKKSGGVFWLVVNKENLIMEEFNSEQEAIDLQKRFAGSKILLRF